MRPGGGADESAHDELVEALVDAGFADDHEARRLLVTQVNRYSRTSITLKQYAVGRDQLIELVTECARLADGAQALSRAVDSMRPGSTAAATIRKHSIPPALDLFPEEDQAILEDCLSGVLVPHVATLVRYLTQGALTETTFQDAWHAVSELADFNADDSGIPPAVLFLDWVAREVKWDRRVPLQQWVDAYLRRHGLETKMIPRRRRLHKAVAPGRLHLVIMLEPDRPNDQYYTISYWCQVTPDQWPPPRQVVGSVAGADLELTVDELVGRAEANWAEHPGDVAIEMVVPRSLLELPFHRFRQEMDSPARRPLFLSYPVVLRSLERMRSRSMHRRWQRRWVRLSEPQAAERVYFVHSTKISEATRLDAALVDEDIALVVLPAPPGPEPRSTESDVYARALFSGVPALLWHPDASSDALRELAEALTATGGLGDLPMRVHETRQKAFKSAPTEFDTNILHDLVLLWDDFDRRLGGSSDRRTINSEPR